MEDEKEEPEEEKMEEPESSSDFIDADTENSIESIVVEPEIVDADWSEYFNGLNGEAVVYDISNRRYTMYNGDSAIIRRSPCSTFKIISSLIALENGIFEPEDSTRIWSGEIMGKREWEKPRQKSLMHGLQDLRKVQMEKYSFVCILGEQMV